jgi:FAD:protein FMN transferase
MLGTFVEIDAPGDDGRVKAAVDEAFRVIEEVQRRMSFHDPESDLSRLNREARCRAVRVHPSTWFVLTKAMEIAAASDGAFDPSVVTVLDPGSTQSSIGNADIDYGNWSNVEFLSQYRIRYSRPLRLDLGGIAKGFAVDMAIEALQAFGLNAGLVSAGGDLRAFGADYLVHLRHPGGPTGLLPPVLLREEALATSANTFSRSGESPEEIAHLVEPHSKVLWRGNGSVTVRSPSCMVADALTKVVLFGGDGARAVLARYGSTAMIFDVNPAGLAA